MPEFRCAAVVLAAGASTRLGQPKQLIRIGSQSLLRRTVRLAIEAGCSPVYVVLGFESDQMTPELTGLAVETVINPAWQQGMGSSLRAGMQALLRAPTQPDAVLLLVCDQPRLTAEHLRELLTWHWAARTKSEIAITASTYAQRNGVPAVFSTKLLPELLAITGDHGARDLIRAHARQVQGIPWAAGEFDIDRPEDLNTIEA
ncbi:MAG TPA: nucleotidyltransferase family protein [Acidobacteriaceae bacterium]|nr:nucleotidyltransferase family protein [Acidobacteriaceae bacterium]